MGKTQEQDNLKEEKKKESYTTSPANSNLPGIETPTLHTSSQVLALQTGPV
jgi:hypothetical protein